MSKDKDPAEQGDRMSQLEQMVLEQGQTIEALRKMLTERTEAAITPQAPAQIVMPNRHLEIERKTQAQVKEIDERQAAAKKAIEAGDFKFMVCIFAPGEEGGEGQLHQVKREQIVGGKQLMPWECKTRPVHPWMMVGVDAPDVQIARILAVEKYNKSKGIRALFGGAVHTLYRVDAEGKPLGDDSDVQNFSRQLQPLYV